MAKQSHSFWFTPKGGALGLIGAASYFQLMEHREHVVHMVAISYCVALHPLMHHRHSHQQSLVRKKVKPTGAVMRRVKKTSKMNVNVREGKRCTVKVDTVCGHW
jgi:hypothetical protein